MIASCLVHFKLVHEWYLAPSWSPLRLSCMPWLPLSMSSKVFFTRKSFGFESTISIHEPSETLLSCRQEHFYTAYDKQVATHADHRLPFWILAWSMACLIFLDKLMWMEQARSNWWCRLRCSAVRSRKEENLSRRDQWWTNIASSIAAGVVTTSALISGAAWKHFLYISALKNWTVKGIGVLSFMCRLLGFYTLKDDLLTTWDVHFFFLLIVLPVIVQIYSPNKEDLL